MPQITGSPNWFLILFGTYAKTFPMPRIPMLQMQIQSNW